jgi:hypothetical protein
LDRVAIALVSDAIKRRSDYTTRGIVHYSILSRNMWPRSRLRIQLAFPGAGGILALASSGEFCW